jgi:hypothetical protein
MYPHLVFKTYQVPERGTPLFSYTEAFPLGINVLFEPATYIIVPADPEDKDDTPWIIWQDKNGIDFESPLYED